MFITFKALVHLPVYTESGAYLGRVRDVECDVEMHQVRHYIVARGFLNKDRLSIAVAQVKAITEEKMIVEDAVSAVKAMAVSKSKAAAPMLGSMSPRIEQN